MLNRYLIPLSIRLRPFLPLLLVLAAVPAAQAQIGVGTTTPNPKAALDISSTDKGLLLPRLTKTQRKAINTPPAGLTVFQTGPDSVGYWYYAGTRWTWLSPQQADNLGNHTATRNLNLATNKLTGGGGNGLTISPEGQATLQPATAAGYQLLHLTSDNNVGAGLRLSSSATGGRSFTLLSTGAGAGAGAGKLGLFDENAAGYRWVTDAAGNFGVGVLTPQARLHVGGSVRIDGLSGTATQMVTADNNGTLVPAALPQLTKSGNQISLNNGGGAVTDSDNQNLTLSGAGLSISSGNSITLPDASATNELQTISKTGSTVTLSHGGGAFVDADNQTLSISGSTISLTNGGAVTVPSSADNLGNHIASQTLRLNGNWLNNDGDPEGLQIDDNGSVGIGTNTPVRRLHVRGDGGILALEGTTHSYLEFYPRGLAAGRKAYLGQPTDGSNTLALENEATAGHLVLTPGPNGGRVGVGTFTPISRLSLGDAAGNGNPGNSSMTRIANYEAPDGAYFYGTGLAYNNQHYGLGIWGGSGALKPFTDDEAGTPAHLFVETTGNVGIGTQSPKARLHIKGGLLLEAPTDTLMVRQQGVATPTTQTTTIVSTLDSIQTGAVYLPQIASSQWQEFIAPQTGQLTAASFRLYASGSGYLRVTVYRYVNGVPSTVIWRRDEFFFGINNTWRNISIANFSAAVTQGDRLRMVIENISNANANWALATNRFDLMPNAASSAGGTTDLLLFLKMQYLQYPPAALLPALTVTGGRVAIGHASPNPLYRLDVNGDIRCAALAQYSDARLKQEVHAIDSALALVERLRGVRYFWRRQQFPALQLSPDEQLGFLAQELVQVLPQAVHQDPTGFFTVDYQKVTPVLVEAIKELKQQLDTARQKAAAAQERATRAEATVNSFETRLQALEKSRSAGLQPASPTLSNHRSNP